MSDSQRVGDLIKRLSPLHEVLDVWSEHTTLWGTSVQPLSDEAYSLVSDRLETAFEQLSEAIGELDEALDELRKAGL